MSENIKSHVDITLARIAEGEAVLNAELSAVAQRKADADNIAAADIQKLDPLKNAVHKLRTGLGVLTWGRDVLADKIKTAHKQLAEQNVIALELDAIFTQSIEAGTVHQAIFTTHKFRPHFILAPLIVDR